MKATTAVMAALMMGAMVSPAYAQNAAAAKPSEPYFSGIETHRRADIACACKNYLAGITSTNEGVVESAIAHVVRMKMYLPDRNFCDLQAAINRQAVAGATPSIRYKAYLAGLVLDNPAWFAAESAREYQNPTELFKALSNRLEKTLAANTGRKYVRPE